MNTIATFRKCTLNNQELLRAVDTLTDKMYKDGKIPDRQIPARPDQDYDLLVGELILRFNSILSGDITTVHHNACAETIKACAEQWGLMKNGQWKDEFKHLEFPVHPPINTEIKG